MNREEQREQQRDKEVPLLVCDWCSRQFKPDHRTPWPWRDRVYCSEQCLHDSALHYE